MNELPRPNPQLQPIDPHTPISEYQPFADYSAYINLRNAVCSGHHARASDAQKLSAEFSKIIITNFQFINAGGLLAVPGLAGTLLGLKDLTRADKLYNLGVPMSSFALGLVCASLCAFFTYRNYQSIAHSNETRAESLSYEIQRTMPRITHKELSDTATVIENLRKDQRRHSSRVSRYYLLGLAGGWASVGCFIFACAWLAMVAK